MNVGVVKKNRLVLRDTVTLRVGSDWIADGDTVSVIDGGDRDESLQLITNIDLASDIHRGISRLILVCYLGLNAENELRARQKRLRVIVPVEPLLRPKDADRRRIIELDDTVWPVDNLQSVLIV